MIRVYPMTFAICLACAATLHAQDEPAPVAPAPADHDADDMGLHWRLTVGGAHQFDSDIDGGGDFSVTRYSLGVGAQYKPDDKLTLSAKVGYEINDYDFDSAVRLGGDPWDTIHSIRFSAGAEYQIDERWSVYGGPIVSLAAEEGADFEHAITGGAAGGASYRVNEDLWVSVGLGVLSRIEDDAAVFPIIRFDWRLTDQWTLRSGSFDLGSEGGAGVELAFAPLKELELAAGIQYQTRRFRLDDSGIAPDGVGEERLVPVYLRVTWTPNRAISATVFGGVIVGGELELENSTGNGITHKDFDPAGVFGGRLVIQF